MKIKFLIFSPVLLSVWIFPSVQDAIKILKMKNVFKLVIKTGTVLVLGKSSVIVLLVYFHLIHSQQRLVIG